MADTSGQTVLNEAALKRFDPYVKKLIDTAKFVALYTFKLKENKWEKTGVEGSLFVYSRTGEPFYNILVLNRLNTTNLIEPISSKLTLQLHEPFLLYLNSKYCLYGMWFYEKEECTRLASLIEKLVLLSDNNKHVPNNVHVMPPNGANVDIYNMLSKAQEAYNSSKSNNNENALSEGKKMKSQEADQTPQSVMEFFAKAGSAPKKQTLTSPPTSSLILGGSHPLPEEDNSNKAHVNPLIHQLMSNPVHLVEHIEKQQRLVTPQANEVPHCKALKALMMQSMKTECSEPLKESNKKSVKLENGISNFSSSQVSPTSLSQLFAQPIPESFNFPVVNGIMETPKKPALMSPAMFTPQHRKEPPLNDHNNDIKLEPLTRNQLFQALNYLLKNDPVFMMKIHEAYIKSLTDKVL